MFRSVENFCRFLHSYTKSFSFNERVKKFYNFCVSRDRKAKQLNRIFGYKAHGAQGCDAFWEFVQSQALFHLFEVAQH